MPVGELPAHNHIYQCAGRDHQKVWAPVVTQQETNDYTTAYCGSNQYHNNLQPSVVVYAWERTS